MELGAVDGPALLHKTVQAHGVTSPAEAAMNAATAVEAMLVDKLMPAKKESPPTRANSDKSYSPSPETRSAHRDSNYGKTDVYA